MYMYGNLIPALLQVIVLEVIIGREGRSGVFTFILYLFFIA